MNAVFAACLQQIVQGFHAQYFVHKHPQKLIVNDIPERRFSFDIVATQNAAHFEGEIWIEGKAYARSSDLMKHYRSFIRNVALTRIYSERRRDDQFWFVSSAPFACDKGVAINSLEEVRRIIREPNEGEKVSINDGELERIEERGYEGLCRSVKTLFLTTQLMQATNLRHYAKPNESIWTITEDLYGSVPSNWDQYQAQVGRINRLASPDLIQIGQDLELPFREDLLPSPEIGRPE